MLRLVILLGHRWAKESFEDVTKFKRVVTAFGSQNYVTNYVATNQLTYLTNSMEHSPSWQANRVSGGQEISLISWNPMVHCVFTRPLNASL